MGNATGAIGSRIFDEVDCGCIKLSDMAVLWDEADLICACITILTYHQRVCTGKLRIDSSSCVASCVSEMAVDGV